MTNAFPRSLKISALLLLILLPAAAKAQQPITPATHMWIRTGVNSVVFVPVSSLQQCVAMTQQAANINSSDALCYNANMLLKKVICQKSAKRGAEPECRTE